ncbi:MAG: hypothetical protein JJV98_01715, partial [Desulfosarcina sp.]|nr:hypothetical protein [Desulfobacterales bacterium]
MEELNTSNFNERRRTPEPCIIVIFGASGDLTHRKLMPALYNLFRIGGLPERFSIVGVARTPLDDASFRDKTCRGLINTGAELMDWAEFEQHLYYRSVRYNDTASYHSLAMYLMELDQKNHTRGNRIFSLAIPPSLYETVAQRLGKAGLSNEDPSKGQWTRLVVEKPFGYDLSSAKDLNAAIGESF